MRVDGGNFSSMLAQLQSNRNDIGRFQAPAGSQVQFMRNDDGSYAVTGLQDRGQNVDATLEDGQTMRINGYTVSNQGGELTVTDQQGREVALSRPSTDPMATASTGSLPDRPRYTLAV